MLRADMFTMCTSNSPGGTPVKLPTFGKKSKLSFKKQAAIDEAVSEAMSRLQTDMSTQMSALRKQVCRIGVFYAVCPCAERSAQNGSDEGGVRLRGPGSHHRAEGAREEPR